MDTFLFRHGPDYLHSELSKKNYFSEDDLGMHNCIDNFYFNSRECLGFHASLTKKCSIEAQILSNILGFLE